MTANRPKQGASREPDKSASDATRVVYTPHPGVAPEAEARALASIYKRAIERSKQKQMVAETGAEKTSIESGHTGGPPKELPAKEGSG